MGTPHLQYININDCVNAYLDESEQSAARQFKIFQLAFRAMDELGLDSFYRIRSERVLVNGNKTVTLPAYCLKVSKVGVLNTNGSVATLWRNDNLTTYGDMSSNRLSKIEEGAISTGLWQAGCDNYFNYWDGGAYYNLYGAPSGQPVLGHYKVDENNGVIVLDPNFSFDYVILECVCAPEDGQAYYVPIQFKEAIIAYIGWKDIRYIPSSRKGNLGEKRDRRSDYYNERRLAIARFKPFDTNVAYQLNLENQRLTVKA